MKKYLRSLLAILTASLVMVPATGQAGPDAPAHGVTSAWVEHIRFVPTEPVLATGARKVGNYLYLTSTKNLSIYDVSDPEDPQLASITPLGLPQWENEDVATNGDILIISQTGNIPLVNGGQNALHVWDVRDKAKPVEIGTLTGAGQHTMTCLYDCTWLYGSSGNIIDLQDPTTPALVGSWAQLAGVAGGHDVREEAPGIVVNSSGSGSNCPGAILDTTDPANPTKLACASGRTPEYMHSTSWPNQATDRFMLAASETNLTPRCGANGTGNGATYVFDMSDWRSGTYMRADRVQGANGWLFDGNPGANALGCSAHWVEASSAFHNGGIFAQGYYEHGTRFFYVNGGGKLTQAGFFTPIGGSTSAVHWITDRIVYAIDYTRGIDVIKYTGPLPSDPEQATKVTDLTATAAGGVTGSAGFAGETTPQVLATDAEGDGPVAADAPGSGGVDLVEASVSQPEPQLPYLQFNWKVSDLPQPDTAPGSAPEAIRYLWSFTANNKEFQVQAKLSNVASTTLVDDPAGHATKMGRAFQLRGDCARIPGQPAPTGVNSCKHLAWLDGSFNVNTNTISVRVPVGASYAPDIKPGAVLSTTSTTSTSAPSIYASYQAVTTMFGVADVGDQSVGNMADGAEWTSYTVPDKVVSLGIAPVGTDPSAVSYSTAATVAPDGSFTGNVGLVPVGYEVFARACFGTSCAYRSVSAG